MLSNLPWMRYIEEGQGRTLRYRPLAPTEEDVNDITVLETVPYVGTSGCITCVGVYFPIDEMRHFFAHIDAQVCSDEISSTQADRLPIRDQVLHKLQQTAVIESWNLDRTKAKGGLVMCCPLWEGDDGVQDGSPGFHVVSGIREFLGCLENECVAPHQREGFVVDLRTGRPRMLQTDGQRLANGVEPREMEQYKRAQQEPLSVDEWRIRTYHPDASPRY